MEDEGRETVKCCNRYKRIIVSAVKNGNVLLQYKREFRHHCGKSWRTQETRYDNRQFVGSRREKEREYGNENPTSARKR